MNNVIKSSVIQTKLANLHIFINQCCNKAVKQGTLPFNKVFLKIIIIKNLKIIMIPLTYS